MTISMISLLKWSDFILPIITNKHPFYIICSHMVFTSGPPVWWDGEPLAPKVPVSDRWSL